MKGTTDKQSIRTPPPLPRKNSHTDEDPKKSENAMTLLLMRILTNPKETMLT